MVGTILHELLGILRPALVGLMTAGMAQNPMAAEAQEQPQTPDEPQFFNRQSGD